MTVITVVGDVLVDRYCYVRVAGPNPEVPGARKLHVTRQEQLLGGAGAVAALLAGAGQSVLLGAVVGGDRDGDWVLRACRDAGIQADIWQDDRRCTTLKARTVLEGRVTGDRVDTEDPLPLNEWIWTRLARIPQTDVLVLQDYGKGTLDAALCFTLIHQGVRKGIPILVDPAYGVPWSRYQGATLIKANLREATQELLRAKGTGAGWHALSLATALEELHRTTIVVTCGAGGMAWATRAHSGWVEAPETPPVDVTGCGDTVLAALAVCPDWPLAEACTAAAAAAAQQVGRLGVRPVPLVPATREVLAG